MGTYETILIEHEAEGVVLLTLNRPARLNAVTGQMLAELDQAVHAINADPSVRTVIVTGAGRAFCAGRDLSELDDTVSAAASAALPLPGGHESDMFRAIEVPTVAAVNGAAVGAGLGFVVQCDVRLAASGAFFLDGHLPNGMVPSVASWYLPRLVGPGRALRLFCSRERLGAEEAQWLGLIDEVVSAEELLPAARRVAALFAQWDPDLLRRTKRLVTRAVDQGYEESMELVGFLRGLERRKTVAAVDRA